MREATIRGTTLKLVVGLTNEHETVFIAANSANSLIDTCLSNWISQELLEMVSYLNHGTQLGDGLSVSGLSCVWYQTDDKAYVSQTAYNTTPLICSSRIMCVAEAD